VKLRDGIGSERRMPRDIGEPCRGERVARASSCRGVASSNDHDVPSKIGQPDKLTPSAGGIRRGIAFVDSAHNGSRRLAIGCNLIQSGCERHRAVREEAGVAGLDGQWQGGWQCWWWWRRRWWWRGGRRRAWDTLQLDVPIVTSRALPPQPLAFVLASGGAHLPTTRHLVHLVICIPYKDASTACVGILAARALARLRRSGR